MEIKTEEDLNKIDKDVEKIGIIDLKYKTFEKKLNSILFTKLEHLSLINTGITSIKFLINNNYSSLIIVELIKNEIKSIKEISEMPFKL